MITYSKRFLITGVTGFLGGHLAADLLAKGHSVVALARDSTQASAKDRVLDALRPLFPDTDHLGDRLMVVSGDVSEPDLGVSDVSVFAGVDEIIHMASLLKFTQKARDRVMSTNVEGTKHMLACAKTLNCQRFHYVSTAYVCGNISGNISETITEIAPQFHNPYEESKWQAERCVDQWHRETGISVTIFRPSIVIKAGPTDSRLGYYAFATVLKSAQNALLAQSLPVVFPGDPDCALNLISVEDVVAAMHAVMTTDPNTSAPFLIVHMTHPHPISLQAAFAAPLEWMGLERHVQLALVTNGNSESPPVIKKIQTLLADLFPYLNFRGHFQTDYLAQRSGGYSPQIIDDVFLRSALADFLPHISKLERRSTAVSIGVAIFLIKMILRPSGLADGQALYVRESYFYRWKHHLTTAFHDRRLRKRAATWVSDHVFGMPTAKVLDLATGTGLTMLEISKQVAPAVELIGMDLNINMLQNAAATEGRLVRGDARDFVSDTIDHASDVYKVLPNSIDAITMVFGIGGVTNPQPCFEQQLRALKPGGIAILIDIHSPSLSQKSCPMPFGLTPSPYLVWQAWQRVTLPIVLAQLWGWGDPTSSFYDMPATTCIEANGKRSRFEVVHSSVETLKWWFGLPVMSVGEIVLRKVVD